MILRIAAAVALILGVSAVLGYLDVVGKGPLASLDQRHLREMKDRLAAPAQAAPITFAGFRALPRHLSVGEYSGLERRGVSIEGYVQYLLTAPDADYHLEVANAPPGAPGYDPHYATAEITPQWSRHSRTWQFDPLLETLRPTRGGATAWEQGPRRVRLTGWLLYDAPHDEPTTRQRRRLTGWEIHPVTKLELWDERSSQYVEYAR